MIHVIIDEGIDDIGLLAMHGIIISFFLFNLLGCGVNGVYYPNCKKMYNNV